MLSNQLIAGIKDCGGVIKGQMPKNRMSPIVSFEFLHQDMAACFNFLIENKVTAAHRAGGIRFAHHAFKTEDEIENVVHLLKQWVNR